MALRDLYTLDYGTNGPRVLFCHGLFGQGRNWNNIARGLSDDYRVTAVDLPNHGRSAWTERVDYAEMADQVAELVTTDDPVALVGHSMGGKVAMALALRHPNLVERLCVVDIAPVDYNSRGEFGRYIEAMQNMDLGAIGTREDADAAMAEVASDPGVRAFLLQNLRREGTGWRWQANLNVLGRDLGALTGWPEPLARAKAYEGNVLWMAGETSNYISDDMVNQMRQLFPKVQKIAIKGAGHWVHSDQPEVFMSVLRAFLAR